MSSPQNAPKYSVLILGSTQAGKSTLIEHIRSYADPGYEIDESLLGDGINSKTDTATPFLISSNLPTYEAYRKDTGEAFELKNFSTQYEDEEDYRDALLSHSDDVGMRLVPQDTMVPSGSMDFQLLDTPGFNGTQDRDSEHVTSIVNEVVSTRSFDLIVFVISSKNPLTEEKELALEFFAYILRGFHSRIVFLYTHVNYADTHHSNTAHSLDMSIQSKTISRIFRRHDGESVFDEFNITEYPRLNINLTTRNRPIVQCMIRNTIREILTMASTPPAALDTIASNIERIRAVTYPTKLGQEQRNNLEATLRKNVAKPKYSVLIIGKTQAGKSTLIEHIKNYANLSYAIDQALLGDGNLSKTEPTQTFYVKSNLPAYEVYRMDTGETIDLDDLPSQFDDEEDYRDILFSRERDVGLRQVPQDPRYPSDSIEFRFLDSLGHENSDENNSNHAAIIIDKLILIQTFNLIVITESYKNLLTQDQQLDLEYFANVFKGLHSKIMFLHTHVDYANTHPSNITHHLNMKMKNKALSKLFRRHDNEVPFDENNFKEYPSLSIDLVCKKRPVITCLIRNTIREILTMATRPALIFDTSIQNIERIRAIPYPTQMTEKQLKQAKARLQADQDKFEEEQAKEEQAEVQDMRQAEGQTEVQMAEDMEQAEVQTNVQVVEQAKVIVEPPTSSLFYIKGQFYIQSPIAGLVLDIESGLLKDPLKVGARVQLAHKRSPEHDVESSLIQQEQQQWRMDDSYIINSRTGHVLDIQGGVVRSGTRVIQNVRKTGKDAAGQQWLNDDGVLILSSNPNFVVTIDGDATRDGTRLYLEGFDTRPLSPSPSRAESISIRPDNFPTSWFYIKSAVSGLVIDIEHGYFTHPMKVGARAEMNYKKIDNGDGRHSLLELQLWRYEAGFLINRRTGFVLDIQGDSLKLAARVVQWQRKSGQWAQNQHWFHENGIIANLHNSRLILDIDGDGSKDGDKIVIGERKDVNNADQKWVLEEVRYQWLANPTSSSASISSTVTEDIPVIDRSISSPKVATPPTTVTVLPTSGWFYIKSQSSSHVVDVEQDADPLAPNVLVSMNAQIPSVTDENQAKAESQLWRYEDGQIINKRSQLVLGCKLGVVRYGTRLVQVVPKWGKESHHQRWESSNGTLVIQGKPLYAIDIEGDGTKNGARLSLQRPKVQNNLDQQWTFQIAAFAWLKIEPIVTRTFTEATTLISEPKTIKSSSWFRTLTTGTRVAAVGALTQVDGIWKRTIQVLTTRKAHVDKVAPIAETSYVYYDDEVYDSVLTEKSTGVTHVTQLLYDTKISKYYVYVRWGETDYKLDGPHDTIESAKSAFQVTYKECFGLAWETRETTVSEQWTYEVKTYETYEEIEYVEEVVEEEEAQIIIKQEKEIIFSEDGIVHEETTTTTTTEEIVLEHATETTEVLAGEEDRKETVTAVVVETGSAKPAVSKGSSWLKKAVGGVANVGAGAAAIGVGAGVAGTGAVKSGAHDVPSGAGCAASGAGCAAPGALEKVDGVWKRTVQVLTTRKAHVDNVAPIAKTSYVYYDDEVYDSVLTEKSTGVTYVTQLLYDTKVKAYYVYVRWGETDYKLDGPHETIESAKSAFQVTYKERFGLEWETRETTVSEQWSYEVKTYETYEEIEYVEEVVEETEAVTLIEQESEIVVKEQSERIAVAEGEKVIKVVTTVGEIGVNAHPTVSKGLSWFRRLVSGAGAVASGALTQVDGVWKRTVRVLTIRKAHVDKVAPIAKTSYVYYDDEVYDSVLIEQSTGVKYITQLLYDTKTSAYYVYVRRGETDYKLNGPHKNIEAAKSAFHITYKKRFGLEWETRETTVSEHWTYEVRTYETFEETEDIEEIVGDYEVQEIVASEQQIIAEDKIVSIEQSVTSSHDDTVVRIVNEQVVSQESSASSSFSSHGGAFGLGDSPSYEYTETPSEETKNLTLSANLPTLNATANVTTTTFTSSGGIVPEGCKNSKLGTKTIGSDKGCGSGSDESSSSSSVLVLGKTQAGKSTFIEFVKNYANQQYTIDESLLGTGFRSKTQVPVQFVVKTYLPAYEVFDATGTRIDIRSLGEQYQDPDDYFDALNDRKTTLKSVSNDPASSPSPIDFEITFLDTPGVEDTNGKDAEQAERIINAMVQMQSFNLIIIIINCEEAPSKAHQLAFNYYSKVIHTFQGHHSNIVFLYTHVEYEKCHHSNADHLSVMELRHKAFSQLFRCQGSYNHEDVRKIAVEPYPMYNIDFDKRQRPVTKCMRLMTLREILIRVVSSPAVVLDTSASSLQRIHAIPHPDEPNQAQLKKLLETTRVMKEQAQEPQDCITVSVLPRGRAMTLEVSSRGACNEDKATDLVVGGYGDSDWKDYFPDKMSDYSRSEEEDDDCSGVLNSGVSMSHNCARHCDDMSKMALTVVQEQ